MKSKIFLFVVLGAVGFMFNGCTKEKDQPVNASNTLGFDTGGWRIWKKNSEANWKGELFGSDYIASDPTVIQDGAIYRMYYTCFVTASDPTDADGITSGFCQVKSTDGHSWEFGSTIDPNFKGVVLRGAATNWDTNMETASIVKSGSTFQLFYSGYKTPTNFANDTRPPSAIGMATSANGDTFTRAGSPILSPTVKGRDADDMFSAYPFFSGGLLRMIYVGWCVNGTYANHDGLACDQTPAIQLLGATRSSGGSWSKRAATVQAPTTNPTYLTHGAAEPAVLVGPDGYTYLFITGGLADNEPRVVGLARSQSDFGPWEVSPEPVLKPDGSHGKFDSCGTFAPSVILEGDKVRMWYLGLDDCNGTCHSCDFASCGCDGKFAIGYAEAAWPLRSSAP